VQEAAGRQHDRRSCRRRRPCHDLNRAGAQGGDTGQRGALVAIDLARTNCGWS